MKDEFFDTINNLKGVKIYKDINIKEDTNMKIDTLFSYKIEIYSYHLIKKVFMIINEYKLKYYIIGKGSNILFSNDCYDEIVIKLMPLKSKYLNIVSAGDSLNYINSIYLRNGISTFNFLSGVPCSIGGAIYMNAGAFNQSISDIVEYVYAFDLENLKYKVFTNKECNFSYRDSYFKHHNYLILGAKIKLKYQDRKELLDLHHRYLKIRSEKLPLEYPNLGSVFKNPDNNYAAKLIQDLGLKGLIVGGSMISKKHANVIVNIDNAKSKDILKLIEIIKEEVYIRYKIDLELEIIIFK